MDSKQKIINLLTMCRRARKTITGFDAACEEVKNGRAGCVMTADDLSEKTKKEVSFICGKYNVSAFVIPVSKEELAVYFGRQTGVVAVCDSGFAKRFAELSELSMQEQQIEKPQ